MKKKISELSYENFEDIEKIYRETVNILPEEKEDALDFSRKSKRKAATISKAKTKEILNNRKL